MPSNAVAEARRLAREKATDATVFIPLAILQDLLAEIDRLQPPVVRDIGDVVTNLKGFRMTNDLEKELDVAIGEVMAEAKKPLSLRPVPPKPASLADQWEQKEKIEQQLRTRVHQERGMIIAEHDRHWLEIKLDYERRIRDSISKLDEERRKALAILADQTAEKLREHDLLAERMDRSLL